MIRLGLNQEGSTLKTVVSDVRNVEGKKRERVSQRRGGGSFSGCIEFEGKTRQEQNENGLPSKLRGRLALPTPCRKPPLPEVGGREAPPRVALAPRSPGARLTSLRFGLMRGRFCPFILWYSPQALHR